MPRNLIDPYTRFDRHVMPEPMSGCWIWTGGTKTKSGYGVFTVETKKCVSAHRFSYERHKGAIPEGMQIDHLCRNPYCVNPDHLEAVTPLENSRRSPFYSGHKTHCHRGHEFNEDNTYYYPSTRGSHRMCRMCKTCARNRTNARRMSLKLNNLSKVRDMDAMENVND